MTENNNNNNNEDFYECNNENENENLFNFIDSIILSNNTEYLCIVDNSKLEPYTETWKYNRTLNVQKIKDIINSYENKDIIDSILYFFYNKENNKYICFDGNHRKEALNILANRGKKIKVLCYIYNNLSEQDVITKFKIINESTPIPTIYYELINNTNSNVNEIIIMNKKEIIERCLHEYSKKYHKFYSTSSKPKRPNFNDTLFCDLCNELENINKIKNSFELMEELNALNNFNKNRLTKKLSIKILEKCKKYDFYLFI